MRRSTLGHCASLRELALCVVILLTGCTTINQRFEAIRKRETVLFDGVAHMGYISNKGDLIFWASASTYPVLATPTTFYFNTNAVPYTSIEGTRVGSFDSAAFLFGKATVYHDLLILDRGFAAPSVFLFVPPSRQKRDPSRSPEQRALAEEAARVIEERRAAVDVFGLERSPQTVGFAIWPGNVFELWIRTPHYLNERFADRKAQLDALFKSNRTHLATVYLQEVAAKALDGNANAQGYHLADIGSVKVNWVRHSQVKKRIGKKAGDMNRFVVLDMPRLFLEEKLDPQGNPSVKARFSMTARFYETANSRLASNRGFSHEATHPLDRWLEEGTELILSELNKAMEHMASELNATLNEDPAGNLISTAQASPR